MAYKKVNFILATVLASSALIFTPTKALAVVQTLNGQTGTTQTFANDTNLTISSANNVHSLGWNGVLSVLRGGTGASSFSNGSLLFFNGSTFAENNSKIFWDNTNNRLGVGTSSPTSTLDVSGNAKVTSLTSTSDSTINGVRIGLGGGSQSDNTVVGSGALVGNTTGVENIALGSRALQSNTSGFRNVGMGVYTLSSNSSGYGNVAIGTRALDSNTIGGSNVAIGLYSAQYEANGSTVLTSPDYGTYIGAGVRGNNSNESNAIVIGANAIGAGSNTAVIGSSALADVYFGSASGLASTHTKKLYLGTSTVPGCIVMGDTAGGTSYITLDNGVLTVSSTPPTACQ